MATGLIRFFGLLAFVATSTLSSAKGDACNVLNGGKKINIFDIQDFSAVEEDLNVVTPPQLTKIVDTGVQLLDGNGVGQFWFTQKHRVAEGFIAEFDFKTTGAPDGLGFVVQNFQDFDTAGDTGETLGYTGYVEAYLGVNFLTCLDGSACADNKVRILKRLPGDTSPTVLTEENLSNFNCSSGCTVQVAYVDDESLPDRAGSQVIVQFKGDTSPLANATFGNLTQVLYGDRHGFFGFSSSATQGVAQTNVLVNTLKMDVQPPSSIVTTPLGGELVFGRTFEVRVSETNSCLEPVSTDELTNVSAVLTLVSREGDEIYNNGVGERVTVDPTVTYVSANGLFNLAFDLPPNIPGVWQLDVALNEVPVDGSPFETAVTSVAPPNDNAIPTWGLALLITLVVLIVLGLIYVVIRLRRYRKKLAENKEDIEAGKEKHHLDNLERGVEFKMNPLMGSLDEMRAQLKKNEEELARLRNGKASLFDDQYTVEQLQQQNAELRDEMNKLKREAQQGEADKMSFGTRVKPESKGRKQFDGQQRA